METKDQLLSFMARRKWDALSAMYGVSRHTMLKCMRENRRPDTLTPDQWEDIIHYREEWHKANNELMKRHTLKERLMDELNMTVDQFERSIGVGRGSASRWARNNPRLLNYVIAGYKREVRGE